MLSFTRTIKSVVKLWSFLTKSDRFVPRSALLLLSGTLLFGCSAGSPEASRATETAQSESPVIDATQQSPSGNLKSVVAQARAVVRKGSVRVRVPDAEKAEKELTRYAASLGGFVSDSHSSNLNETSPTVAMTVRVPVQTFDASLEKIESMGTRLEKTVSGEDVTGQLVDFEARLKTMQAQEESFRNILRNTTRSTEALDVETRLMKLREEIESVSAQRKALGGLASLSTIEVTFVGSAAGAAKTDDKGWAQESWSQASGLFAWIAKGLGSLAIFVAVMSPFWLPVVAVLWWAVRKGTRETKQRHS